MAEQQGQPQRGRLSKSAAFGWALYVAAALSQALGLIGNIDLAVARWNDPGWLGTVARFVVQHRVPLALLAAAAGFVLILRNERRATDRLIAEIKQQKDGRPAMEAAHQLRNDILILTDELNATIERLDRTDAGLADVGRNMAEGMNGRMREIERELSIGMHAQVNQLAQEYREQVEFDINDLRAEFARRMKAFRQRMEPGCDPDEPLP